MRTRQKINSTNKSYNGISETFLVPMFLQSPANYRFGLNIKLGK